VHLIHNRAETGNYTGIAGQKKEIRGMSFSLPGYLGTVGTIKFTPALRSPLSPPRVQPFLLFLEQSCLRLAR
jgi:hypothetical protein